MLHAKIVGDTRDGVVALASKKSLDDIFCHAGNLRKSASAKQQQAAATKAVIHAVGKSAVVAKPARGKPHLAAEPSAGVVKPAAVAKPHPAAEPPAIAQPNDVNSIVRLVCLFDNYTAELDDGSNVLVKAHDVTITVDHQKGIQVDDLIGKFNENLLLESHQKARYC
jgi:hypothetical protein